MRQAGLDERNVADVADVAEQPEPGHGAGGTGYAKSECGDWVRMWIMLGEDGRIAEARFRYFGCASVLATSSALAALARGLTPTEALELGGGDVERALGGERHKAHCSQLSLSAFNLAIRDCLAGPATV